MPVIGFHAQHEQAHPREHAEGSVEVVAAGCCVIVAPCPATDDGWTVELHDATDVRRRAGFEESPTAGLEAGPRIATSSPGSLSRLNHHPAHLGVGLGEHRG